MNNKQLLFVYNADSTLTAAASDFVTRVFSSDDYSCNLCQVTYTPINTMKSSWKKYLQTIPNEKEFLHRDEFREQYADYADTPLPAIFVKTDSGLRVLVSAKEINTAEELEDMKRLLSQKLSQL